ncbi:unnamed protein product [Didymodactylos carnosus]|uniref:Uncharacterized protein n=1 Tax=Didymodactylos carnosus TaxID=1234261 RepID=A0A814N661_9BILA|nr:unnamed protein product [Didymodactylos carnosus]CAF1088887.1 unnamed protein product [Didymodactylos carnosus]CAF3642068.1 unnamed protein product [Didymodactylos carnosus]CAF3854395.1 unnamed protein product [Didymodactylos carnosus]
MDGCLNDFIRTAESSLSLLGNLVDDIEAHHTRCNVVKTAGTTASVAGGALTIVSIGAAFFTGGLSLVALAGAGAITGAAGAVTNLGTDVVDLIWTKKYSVELEAIDIRLQYAAKQFAEYVDLIEAEAARIFKTNGKNEEEALMEAFWKLAKDGKLGWDLRSKCVDINSKVGDIAKNVGRTSGSTVLRNGGNVWKGMRLNSYTLASAFKKIGFDVSRRAAFNVVRVGTLALSAVFIVWDIKSLANSLDNDHPAVGPVKTQIEKIRELLGNLKELKRSCDF